MAKPRCRRSFASSASRCGCSGAYAFVATLQPDAHVGRILAAYGGVFEAPAWAMALDGFRPDRFDVLGAAVCLAGVG